MLSQGFVAVQLFMVMNRSARFMQLHLFDFL